MAQIIYGKNALIEVVNAGKRKVQEVLVLGNKNRANDPSISEFLDEHKITYRVVDRNRLDTLAEGGNHHGVVSKVADFAYAELGEVIQAHPQKAFFVICDSINDPQNFGAICRSAYCFGASAIILPKDRSVEVTSVVVSASAGAIEHLPVVKVVNIARALEELKEAGFWCYAADANAQTPLDQVDPSEKCALVLGSEREGIRPLVLKNCDFHFSIPMAKSFDSLNVAQAASVICYALASKGKW